MAALGSLGGRCRLLLCGQPAGLLRDLRKSGRVHPSISIKRNLLSEDVVKLHSFQQHKLAKGGTGANGSYVQDFHQKLQRNKLILKKELELLLHVCQSVDDMAIARVAIQRYHEGTQEFDLGEFTFGPLFMRLCYELGLEEMAAATVTDKKLRGFFSDATSFNIAIDMLFTKGCYERALELLREMMRQGVPFNTDTYLLACGTCYKLGQPVYCFLAVPELARSYLGSVVPGQETEDNNTPESYRFCTTLTEQGQTKRHLISRHAYCFAVALALRQNDTKKAKCLYSHITNTKSQICENLKVVIRAMSGDSSGAISVLSSAMSPNSIFVKKLEFAQEVVELLRSQSEGGPHMVSVEQTVSALQKAGQVTQRSLGDMLCQPAPCKMKPLPGMVDRRVSGWPQRTLRSMLLSE